MNNNSLQTNTYLCTPQPNINISMPNCSTTITESKSVTISADLVNGVQMQYFSNRTASKSITRENI